MKFLNLFEEIGNNGAINTQVVLDLSKLAGKGMHSFRILIRWSSSVILELLKILLLLLRHCIWL